jgi:hypothetical protein
VLFLAADGRMRYEGVPDNIDLGKSRANAELEAQLLVPDRDPAGASIHMS